MPQATQYRTTRNAMSDYVPLTLKLAEIFLDAGNLVLGTEQGTGLPIVLMNGSFVNGKVYLTFSDTLPNDPGAAYYELESMGQSPL